jgi:hypothetical protein
MARGQQKKNYTGNFFVKTFITHSGRFDEAAFARNLFLRFFPEIFTPHFQPENKRKRVRPKPGENPVFGRIINFFGGSSRKQLSLVSFSLNACH